MKLGVWVFLKGLNYSDWTCDVGFIDLRQALEELNVRSARTRTVADRRALLSIPKTVTNLERRMNDLAEELSSTEFLQLSGSSGTIQVYCI